MFLVGRKNGKSTLLAAIALYMLIAGYEGAAEIYSVATKKGPGEKSLDRNGQHGKAVAGTPGGTEKASERPLFHGHSVNFEALASDSNTLDDRDEWTDPAKWEKANLRLGQSSSTKHSQLTAI